MSMSYQVPLHDAVKIPVVLAEAGPVATDGDGFEIVLACLEGAPEKIVLHIGTAPAYSHIEAGIVALAVAYSFR
jgi:hypothetical protein